MNSSQNQDRRLTVQGRHFPNLRERIEAKVCYSHNISDESYVLAKAIDVKSCMANQLSRDISVGPIL